LYLTQGKAFCKLVQRCFNHTVRKVGIHLAKTGHYALYTRANADGTYGSDATVAGHVDDASLASDEVWGRSFAHGEDTKEICVEEFVEVVHFRGEENARPHNTSAIHLCKNNSKSKPASKIIHK
jgi:hypothetical protein